MGAVGPWQWCGVATHPTARWWLQELVEQLPALLGAVEKNIYSGDSGIASTLVPT